MLGSMHRSVRRKVMVLVLGTTVSALALSAAGLVVYDLRAYERQTSADMEASAEVLARSSAAALSSNDRRTAANDLKALRARADVLGAALYTRTGELLATYEKTGAPPVEFPAQPGADGYRIEGSQLALFRRVVERGDPIGTVYLRAVYTPWDRLRDYLGILGVVMVASLGLAAFLSGWLQRALTEPILEVARVAREVITQRDYSLRARKTTDDEIGQLVDAFNALLAEAGRRAEALREADRRKDEFLATLAHELRNPLAPLRNALQILRMAESDPATTRKARDMMERQLHHMVRLVDDLLDVSRITTGKLAIRKSVIDLEAVVRDAVETARPFIESRRHTLDVHVPPEHISVEGDRTRLAQVLGNLLHNAAKYTEPGGHLSIRLERTEREAMIHVRDNGIGLAPQSLVSIFDMFVQVDRSLERAQAGLGVGLSLARQLVNLHGGTIEARSDGVGKGSEFVVKLPLAGVPLEAVDTLATPEDARIPSRRILLADDNVDFANSLAALLSAQGHVVRVAHDGAEALNTAARFNPDFAFLDIGMPKVHGYEVARRFREQVGLSDCVLVAVTGWGQEDDRRRAREAGFDRHLVKPVDADDIEVILKSY
jgi:signal transduction histidine kinase